jgi:hypothetical protein
MYTGFSDDLRVGRTQSHAPYHRRRYSEHRQPGFRGEPKKPVQEPVRLDLSVLHESRPHQAAEEILQGGSQDLQVDLPVDCSPWAQPIG